MSIETPDHWSGETRRFAGLVSRLMSRNDESRVEEGLLAIAVELAELRKKTMVPEMLTAVLESKPEYGQPLVLGQSWTDGETNEERNRLLEVEATQSLVSGPARLRFVGWYCPGGHPLPSRMHSGQQLDKPADEPDMAVAGVRFDDPCEYSVPMFVLGK